jgi:hypothetical protein
MPVRDAQANRRARCLLPVLQIEIPTGLYGDDVRARKLVSK